MSNNALNPKVSEIKIAAKRLKKSIPGKTHMQLLDIATHAFTGKKTFHELQKLDNVQNISILEESDVDNPIETVEDISFGKMHNITPTIHKGNWKFYPDKGAVSFDGTRFSPYVVFLSDSLGSTGQLLDCILQIQKKKHIDSKKGENDSSAFETDNFISLIDELCRYYFKKSIQGVFSPSGKNHNVDWASVLDLELSKDVH